MYGAGIIADDFSSATDCGVQFALSGNRTCAYMAGVKRWAADCQVLSLDTDSRECVPEEAYRRVYEAATRMAEAGCERVFKSIDSTLRGNIGAEINAAMDAFGFHAALVAPAFPHYGRTTREGIHYLNGVPLAQSPISKDPTRPARESSIAGILRAQTGRKPAFLTLAQVRGGDEALRRCIREACERGAELLIPDVEKESDLEILARATRELPELLCVGSTGLARHLPGAWFSPMAQKQAEPPLPGRLLAVAGSAAALTRAQTAAFLACDGVEGVMLDPAAALSATPTLAETLAKRLSCALLNEKDALLYVESTPEARERSAQCAAERGLTVNDLAARISALLAEVTKQTLRLAPVHKLALTGGDTAKAVMLALGADGLRLFGEMEAGIPAGYLPGEQRVAVVTKAGAFGSEGIFDHIRQAFGGGE